MPNKLSVISRILLILLTLFCFACTSSSILDDDLDHATIAMQNGDWTQAERLLQRFLRLNHDSERRFEAWQWLLEVNNRLGADTRSSLDFLEVMLLENNDDDNKLKFILKRMAELYEKIRQSDRAIESWNNYIDLTTLTDEESVMAHRTLARLHFRLRSFDAGEEVLQSCLALNIAEAQKTSCLYDLADANMAREQWATATSLALQILEIPVDDKLRGLTTFLLGDAYEQQNKLNEALAQFEASRGYYPNDLVVENRIAFLRKKLKK